MWSFCRKKMWQSGFSNQTNVKTIKTKNIPVSSSLKCALHIFISSPRHPLVLIYHPAEIIRLHARRGPWVPASTHRLQNHSETPPKQSGTTGARPSPSVSRQQETWDHEGCWDCRRAATIYWHFMEVNGRGWGGRRFAETQSECKSRTAPLDMVGGIVEMHSLCSVSVIFLWLSLLRGSACRC